MKTAFPTDKIGGTQEFIFMFREDERYLSNFWPCNVTLPEETVVIDGEEINLPAMDFDSTENAYMAWKTLDLKLRKKIQTLDAGDAKELTHEDDFPTRPDYSDNGRIAIMEILVRQKYSIRNPWLMEKLMNTGTATIAEGNTWSDTFFGFCLRTGTGQNWLGRITMKIRDELLYPMLKK